METLAYILAALSAITIIVRFFPAPKIMLGMLSIVALCIVAVPQTTNVHVAVNTHGSPTGGVDYRRDKFVISGDIGREAICKNPGGCGHQLNFRGTVAYQVRPFIYVQGGIVDGYYRVPLFSKNSLQLLGGVRFALLKDRLITELNYRHDLTSENKLRIVEARATAYLPKHIFIRAAAVTNSFVVPQITPPFHGRQSGYSISFGVYF